MSVGTLIFLLLIGGSLFAMFTMHRGGQSHGMGMGCGGHGHANGDERRYSGDAHDDRAGRTPAEPDGQLHGDEPAPASRHRGC